MEPKRHQNRAQFLTSRKYLSKTVLEQSWSHLGAFLEPSSGAKTFKIHYVFLAFLQKPLLTKNASQEPSWTQLGATWGPKGSQKSPPKGTQEDQKWVPKTKQKQEAKKKQKKTEKDPPRTSIIPGPAVNGKRRLNLAPLGASWAPLGCLLGASSLAYLSFA